MDWFVVNMTSELESQPSILIATPLKIKLLRELKFVADDAAVRLTGAPSSLALLVYKQWMCNDFEWFYVEKSWEEVVRAYEGVNGREVANVANGELAYFYIARNIQNVLERAPAPAMAVKYDDDNEFEIWCWLYCYGKDCDSSHAILIEDLLHFLREEGVEYE